MWVVRTYFLFFIIVGGVATVAFSDSKVKRPNVNGQFYEANPKRLSANIDQYFDDVPTQPSAKHIEMLIAPHAGYMYSGGVAAHGFKAASRNVYKTIIILAPSHYVPFDGISIWDEGGFETPLGMVDVDEAFAKNLINTHDQFYFLPQAFDREHSLEVEIPFLQKAFTGFKIVPVIMGQPNYDLLDQFAQNLLSLIGNREDVLIVVSTDLSHYHEDAVARSMDRRTIDAVRQLKAEEAWKGCKSGTMEMCGCVPVVAALLYAQKKGLTQVDVLKYAHSGDVSGDMDRVVGYASMIFYKNGEKNSPNNHQENTKNTARELTQDQKKRLLEIARTTVEAYVRNGKKLNFNEQDGRLSAYEGAFVTIHKGGRLRGCIGNIIGQKPLYQTVRDMAIAAASQDPRFTPVMADELKDIDVEVSVLSKPWIIKNIDEIELGKHGVIVSRGPFHNGVFLPQVATETNWSKEEFLSQLCAHKAGLPADAWKDPQTQIEIFTADVFSETESY